MRPQTLKFVNLYMPDLLKYQATCFQISKCFEVYGLIKMETKKVPLNDIESELDAINKVNRLRQLNESMGIMKTDRWYYYKKLAFMSLNDLGLQRTDDHFFLDKNGERIRTCLN